MVFVIMDKSFKHVIIIYFYLIKEKGHATKKLGTRPSLLISKDN